MTDAMDMPASPPDPPRRGLGRALIKLARPTQWAKSAFVVLGPLYGLRDYDGPWQTLATRAAVAGGAFALASSACYVVNDLLDADSDRNHPRKRLRPIARGEVSKAQATVLAAVLLAGAAGGAAWLGSGAFAALLGLYVVNVWAYSLRLKHAVIADVMSLAMGFVLRVLAGCAAVGIAPSTWLLNVTLFLAMFLAFGKRLGERRTLADASVARGVQRAYTDDLLRMLVVVTGVATLVTYAAYVVTRGTDVRHLPRLWEPGGHVNLLWFSLVPATYALFRSIVMLERGRYDDPTEMATHDGPMQAAVAGFVAISVGAMLWHPAGA